MLQVDAVTEFQDLSILLVEDSPADAELVRRGVERWSQPVELHVVETAEEALEWLHQPGGRRPSLMLLDLNLPGMSGLELLSRLKVDRRMRSLPVVVLTTSADPREVERAFSLGAAGYHVKPVDYARHQGIVRAICDYWLAAVELPQTGILVEALGEPAR